MPRTLELTWNDLELTLHADRALSLGDHLLIADVHLGKPAAFRAQGSPVPEALTGADLDAVSNLLHQTNPARLVILGDFLHAPESHHPAVLDALRAWRRTHDLPVTLIRGNHDESAGDPPADLTIDVVNAPHALGACRLRHEPDTDPALPTIAGHLHPGVSLRRGGWSMRAACFHITPRQIILPAFGAFTGLAMVRPKAGDRIVAVGEDALIEVPTVTVPGPRRSARSRTR